MVYAMLSIGVLGFIVWSRKMALYSREEILINFTIGWDDCLSLFLCTIISTCFIYNTKLGNLLDTFYSLNANKNVRPAGNFFFTSPPCPPEGGDTDGQEYPPSLRGGGYASPPQNQEFCDGSTVSILNLERNKESSEIIRENTYDLFKENFAYFFKQEFSKDNNWLSWFIGFLEGDGAILEHKGRPSFVLTQKDDTVLHEIFEVLKIGNIRHFYDSSNNKKYSRYIVSDNKGIFLLYILLNGNLVLERRVNQLKKWNIALNKANRFDFSLFYSNNIPGFSDSCLDPSLNNGWLSGFSDAEGCFSVKISKKKKDFYIQLLFILDQKNEETVLNKIALLFNTSAKAKLRTVNKSIKIKNLSNYNNSMFRLSIYCNDKKKSVLYNICNYFNKYSLKTNKNKSFQIWCQILKIVINKKPLLPNDLDVIRKLRRNMNYYSIENKPLGHGNKS